MLLVLLLGFLPASHFAVDKKDYVFEQNSSKGCSVFALKFNCGILVVYQEVGSPFKIKVKDD